MSANELLITNELIIKTKKINNNKYDYSLVNCFGGKKTFVLEQKKDKIIELLKPTSHVN